METQLLVLVDRAGQSGFGHRTTSFYLSHLCVTLYLNDHKVCNCVFTYWTRRNWRDEFLVPGFKLVNFNDWFLDFNWFLFYWNGDFFLWKSNETDTIKKKLKWFPGNGKFFRYSRATWMLRSLVLTWFLLGDKRSHPPPQVWLVLAWLTRLCLHTVGLQTNPSSKTVGIAWNCGKIASTTDVSTATDFALVTKMPDQHGAIVHSVQRTLIFLDYDFICHQNWPLKI